MARRPLVLPGPGTRGRLFQVHPAPPPPFVPVRQFLREHIATLAVYRRGSIIAPYLVKRVPAPTSGPLVATTYGRRPPLTRQRSSIVIQSTRQAASPAVGGPLRGSLTRIRVLPLPAPPRGRSFELPPEYLYLLITGASPSVMPLLYMRRGRLIQNAPNAANITTPTRKELLHRWPLPLPAPPRGRTWTPHFTPPAPPPPAGPGPLVDRSLVSRRRPLQLPRGHMWQPVRRLVPRTPQWVVVSRRPFLLRPPTRCVVVAPPQEPPPPFTGGALVHRVLTRHPALLKQRHGFTIDPYRVGYIQPGHAPVVPALLRPAGTQHRVLKIARSTLPGVLNAFVPVLPPNPPPLPSPAGGSVSVSTGRRKWPRAVLYAYPKSLVWKGRNG